MFTQKQFPRVVCIVWALIFWAPVAMADKVDSLKQELSEALDKTRRMELLVELADATRDTDFDAALKYGIEGYELAKELKRFDKVYDVGYAVMRANLEKNQLKENAYFIKDFETLYDEAKIGADDYGRILYLESFTAYMLEDVDALQSSVEKLKKVQPEVSDERKNKIQGYIYYFGAQFFTLEENYSKADSLLRLRLALNEEAQDSNGIAASYFDLALLHTEYNEDFDKALDYAEKGLKIAELTGWQYVADRLLSLQFYARVKNGYIELAATQLDTMLRLAEKAVQPIFSARVYLSMGDFYHEIGNYEAAGEYYLKSEQQLSGEVNDPLIKRIYIASSNNFLAMEETLMAYNYMNKALTLTDSIHQAELIKVIDYHKTQIDLIDKANENLKLNDTLRRRSLYFAFALLVALFLLYVIWQKIKTNQKLKKLNEKIASDAEKLAKANEHLEFFSRSIYHDITSRINLILSFSELKQNSPLNASEENGMDEFTLLIYKNALFLKQFVQDIRTFSRLEENGTPPKEIDLNSVVSLVLETFGGQIYEKNAVLNIPDLPIITGHETPIVQLFQNLTENAIKYTRENAEPLINIGFKETEDYYQFSVENNGSPIPEEVADRIFEPFYRIKKKNVNGSGLGLAICKRIVDYYGGQLWLEKSDEVSTIFSFTLPKVYNNTMVS